MLKVISVVDKQGTALDRLAKGVMPYHQNLDYHVVDVHPKRPSTEQLSRFESLSRTADIMDYQYYRTADMLRSRYEWLKDIPSVLSHNNPYSIKERDWNDYQVNVANNRTIYDELKKISTTRIEYISLAVDPYFWIFNEDYEPNPSAIMVANRIESKKGILPVAEACHKVGVKLYLVGAISDPDYWHRVMEVGNVEFAQECTDEQLKELYYKAGVHICNSIDNFESGTLPILEAIFCGLPVITRNIGHVPDIKTETNLVINDHDPEDVQHLANLISDTLLDKRPASASIEGSHYKLSKTNKTKLDSMRSEAWLSIKDKNFERRAYAYQKLYRELLQDTPVSVIMPIAEKEEITRASLEAVANQTHKNIEVIVIDDGEQGQEENVRGFSQMVNIPVRYIRLGGSGYNLAKARNIGAIEATSDILVFCDQRQVMNEDCVEEFVANLKPKYWLYGNKGAKKDFVENLSCIYREDFFTFGGFNERITQYGGLSQETRSRARKQLLNIEYVDSAKATPMGKSSNRWRKRVEIMQSKNTLWKMGMH